MGRTQYLTRLALGRSPFQGEACNAENDNDEHVLDEIEDSSTAWITDDQATDQTTEHSEQQQQRQQQQQQQYDSKGRPTNPAAEARCTAMRNATNAVLALVGVVERNNTIERQHSMVCRLKHYRMLRAEHDHGDALRAAAFALYPLEHATTTLVARIQIGLYPLSRPFARILADGARAIRLGGFAACWTTLFPGFTASVTHEVLRFVLRGLVPDGYCFRRRRRRPDTRRPPRWFTMLADAVLLSIDLLLLPLEYHAYAQQLGLAPATPLLPSWRSFLPWHPTSPHHFGWRSLALQHLPLISILLSPCALILLHSDVCALDNENDPALSRHFTSFHNPRPFNTILPRPPFLSDPAAWLMHHIHTARLALFPSIALTSKTPPPNLRVQTALSTLPPDFLASRLSSLTTAILLLPLRSTLLRTVAATHLSAAPSPLWTPHLHPPWAGPLADAVRAIRTPGAPPAHRLAHYASHLGLALATQGLAAAGTFCALARVVRTQGVRQFGWGGQDCHGNGDGDDDDDGNSDDVDDDGAHAWDGAAPGAEAMGPPGGAWIEVPTRVAW